jgi:ubiquitin-like protein Nedd8
VSQIKEKVEEKEGIPPVQQRLIFGGKQMYVSHSLAQHRPQKPQITRSYDSTCHFTSWLWNRPSTYPTYPAIYPSKFKIPPLTPHQYRTDEKTAAEYQLEGGATLHLVLALRGGFAF